jgi:methionyl-tRNA synthetase
VRERRKRRGGREEGIPGSVLKALKIFNLGENDIKLEDISKNEFLIKGNSINKIDILFKKIEKDND